MAEVGTTGILNEVPTLGDAEVVAAMQENQVQESLYIRVQSKTCGIYC